MPSHFVNENTESSSSENFPFRQRATKIIMMIRPETNQIEENNKDSVIQTTTNHLSNLIFFFSLS